MKNKKPTYKVIDLHYSENEDQDCFYGDYDECVKFKVEQCEYSKANEFMLKIVPIV